MIYRCLLLVATLLTPLTAQAGLILTGKDADFLLGGTDNTVDFTIESNAGELLSSAGFRFRITPLTGPVNELAFVSPQTNPLEPDRLRTQKAQFQPGDPVEKSLCLSAGVHGCHNCHRELSLPSDTTNERCSAMDWVPICSMIRRLAR